MATIDSSLVQQLRHTNEVAVVIADDQGYIREVNDRFAADLGFAREEIVGQQITRIIPEEMRDAHHMGFGRFLETGRSHILGQLLQLPVKHGSGPAIQAEICIEAWQEHGKWILGATIQPLT